LTKWLRGMDLARRP